MRELDKALADIRTMRRQMARSTEFRGYGPATLIVTSVLAVMAATAQSVLLPDPASHINGYLCIWVSTAVLCASLAGAQTYIRSRRIHTGMSDEMLHMAIEQFFPSVGASALVTFVLLHYLPNALWMLPGFWQLIFSLGVFASCRFLPRWMPAAGAWYLLSALVCFALGDGRALSPWVMGIPFAVGQLLVAGILFFSGQEAHDEI
jgi:hypothetical protein